MKRCVLGGVLRSLAALPVCGPAAAADMQPYQGPASYRPYDWSGIYIGIHGGYAYAHALATISRNGVEISRDDTMHGTVLGGQIGANAQTGALVLGFEGDISKAWQGQSYSAGVLGLQVTVDSDIPWLATFRGRAGIAADQWLIYATAGLAVMGVETTGTATFGNRSVSATLFDPKVAFAWGGGIETALWASNITARIEYLNILPVDTSEYTGSVDFGTKASNSILRIGVNARFGGGMK